MRRLMTGVLATLLLAVTGCATLGGSADGTVTKKHSVTGVGSGLQGIVFDGNARIGVHWSQVANVPTGVVENTTTITSSGTANIQGN